MPDCLRCQEQARKHQQTLRLMREKVAVCELRARLSKQGKTPTRAEEQAAKQTAHAKAVAKDREKAFREREKNLPAHRRI